MKSNILLVLLVISALIVLIILGGVSLYLLGGVLLVAIWARSVGIAYETGRKHGIEEVIRANNVKVKAERSVLADR